MKKAVKIVLSLTLALSTLFAFAGCGKNSTASDKTNNDAADKTITIGASVTPHAEILKEAAKVLKKEGYTLNIKEYNDYVLPNTATESGELDANYFQHTPYLENFNKENNTHLVSIAKVHYEPFGIYAGKTSSLKDLKDGATVAVPNDTTNEARALLLLQDNGLITLKDGAGLNATAVDITKNPKNLKFKEIEAAQLVRSIKDVDVAVINGNYAIEGGLKVSDALAAESAQSTAAQTYANILVVKEGNENTPKIEALKKALLSDEVRKYINDTYAGAVVPIF